MPNIYQVAMFHAQRRPTTVAVQDGAYHLTYLQLGARARALAAWLASHGVRRGDRVAVVAENSVDYIALMHATAVGGFILVPVNTRYRAEELAFLVNDCSPTVVIYDHVFEDLVRGARTKVLSPGPLHWEAGFPKRVTGQLATQDLDVVESRSGQVEDDEIAMIIYTSGTTSAPKGAMLTHANVAWNAINHLIELGIDDTSRTLLVTPLFHIAGYGVLNGAVLYAGGTMHVVSKFDAQVVLDAIRIARPTHLFLLATMWVALTDHPAFASFSVPSVKYIQAAGATISTWRQNQIRRAFPGAEFGFGFGMTETCVTTIKNRFTQEIATHPGSLGYCWRHVAYRLVDQDGNVLQDQRGPGELQIKGPTVFKGYWKQPERTAEVLSKDGWLSTGDLMRFDEDGFAYFVGRVKDMVKTGGENVAAAEVEDCLLEHPNVSEAAAFGLPHEYWGEELVAAVLPVTGQVVDGDALREWCKERISSFKVPKRIFIVDNFPLSSSGKVQKFRLRERFAQPPSLTIGVGSDLGGGS